MTASSIDWNRVIGSIWHNVLLSLEVPRDGVIVEIAPGNVNKIGHGLSDYHFQGTIYLVEPNANVLTSITKQYQRCMPSVNVFPLAMTLEQVISHLPQRADAVITNHPLDDMIIGKSLDDTSFKSYFDDHYDGADADRTKMYWETLVRDKRLLKEIEMEVVNEWDLLIKSLKPKNLVISQYESYFFKVNGITEPDQEAFKVLKEIKGRYERNSNSLIPSMLSRMVFDIDRWMFLTF